MTFAGAHPQPAKSAGSDLCTDGLRTQPQHEPVTSHHHFLPPTWQRSYIESEYQRQGWQQPNGNQWPSQDEEHKRDYEHLAYSRQQPYWWHQEQGSPHHVFDISQSRQSFGEPCHPGLTRANSPSAAPEHMPGSELPLGQSYDRWSSEQVRCDEKLPVPDRCVNKPTSVPAASTTESSFQHQGGTDLGNEGARRGSELSPASPRDSRSARDDSTSAGSDPCQSSVRSNYTSGFQRPDATSQNPGGPPQRVRTACEECRQKKIKCDNGRPCRPCQRRKLPCGGRGPTSASAKEEAAIQSATIQEMENITQEFIDRITSVMQDEHCRKDRQGPRDSALWPEPERSRMLSPPQSEHAHRTGPIYSARSWESLQVLLRAADVNLESSYIMEAEERPSLCLYPEHQEVRGSYDTQGGMFTSFACHHGSTPDNVFSTSTGYCGYDLSERPLDDRGVRPHTCVAERQSSADSAPLDLATIEALHENYMKYIHVVQPFLDAVEIRSLLDDFVAWHGIWVQPSVAAGPHDTTSNRPFKRRRQDQHSYEAPLNRSRLERSLGRAVIYLILALGEICKHGPRPPYSLSTGQWETSCSPSAHMHGEKSAPLSLDDADTTFRGSSQPQSAAGALHGDHGATNCKAPGLDYYVKAVEIFGLHSDGSDLILAQLFLLAGLYKGQLARVKESMSWYVKAGWVLVQLLRRHGLTDNTHGERTSESGETLQDGSRSLISDKYRSSIVRASYSCIQLESDIRAHCDLPSSGIANMETMLPVSETFADVSGSQDDSAQSVNVAFHFTSQAYLRIQLNRIHEQLYGPCHERRSLAETRFILRDQEAAIKTWQETLPPGLSWDPKNAPPNDILSAHLRANYWTARYLINRPFLDYFLHVRPHPRLIINEAASPPHQDPLREVESHMFRAIAEMSEEEVEMGYRTCIKAAEKSTIAFDNVLGQLIVTNIHGTAHAQFDNVLVLCSAYWHSELRRLVDETTLRYLLFRTISFLDRLAPLSPTCRIDSQILKKVQRLLFDIPYSEG